MRHSVYLGLGTNLGDRQANLRAAVKGLPPGVEVRRVSPIYETEPWGYEDQPPFLNQAAEAATDLPPEELLAYLKALETSLGRVQSFRYGPRLIDLDILLYDNLVLETPGLVIPHPRLAERAFVLAPLADLAPGLVVPGKGQTAAELLAGLDKTGIRRL